MKKLFGAFLTFLLACSVTAESDPSIECYGDDSTGIYTARVFLENDNGYDFGTLTRCNTIHRPNFTDADVKKVVIMGNSKNIPSIICKSFGEVVEIVATGIGLNTSKSINKCENLEILDLSENKITKIAANQFSSTKLKQLDLSQNQIVSTDDDSLSNLEGLEVLKLSQNPGIQIEPYFFQYGGNLTTLKIDSCELSAIETTWMNNITNLIIFDISHNPDLGELPSTIFWKLKKLRTLYINSCGLTKIAPQQFYYNSDLQHLDMRSNQLKTLVGTVFRNQTSLGNLLISSNPFENIPGEIFTSLVSLRNLEMRWCNIQNLTVSWFATTAELRSLDLAYNSITELPYKTFGVENKLQSLSLQNNNLKVLDATSFALLKDLQYLRVENNNISAVDNHFIQQPKRLYWAHFGNNECINVNIDDFYLNQEENLELFKECFYNFDQIPVVMNTNPGEPYRWYSMRWNTLVLHIKASSNVSLVFSDIQSEDYGASLKVKIGMNRNLNTFIYENDTQVWWRETPDILDDDEWKSFVISWEYKVLQFYKEGWQLPRAMHVIKAPFDINFFGVRADEPASFYIQRIEENFLHEDFPSFTSPITTERPTTTIA